MTRNGGSCPPDWVVRACEIEGSQPPRRKIYFRIFRGSYRKSRKAPEVLTEQISNRVFRFSSSPRLPRKNGLLLVGLVPKETPVACVSGLSRRTSGKRFGPRNFGALIGLRRSFSLSNGRFFARDKRSSVGLRHHGGKPQAATVARVGFWGGV